MDFEYKINYKNYVKLIFLSIIKIIISFYITL